MITLEEVKEISRRLSLENGMSDDTLSEDALNEDISGIVYRTEVFECGDSPMIDRHVDIEYSFGEYYEIGEDTSLFEFISTLCNLPLLLEEQEIVLWKK